MTFREKIDKILEINPLGINSVTALEDKIQAGRGAINDFYKENREPGRKTLKRIKTLDGLNDAWWTTGKGPVFLTVTVDESSSSEVGGKADPHNDTYRILREALEEGSEYRIIPKTILDGEYRIMPKKELDKYEKQFDKIDERTKIALTAKDELIEMKNQVIKEREEKISSLEKQLRALAQKTE